MRTRRVLSDERLELFSPIGLRLIDTFTGAPPIGRIRPFLDISDGSGGWRPTNIKAVRTPSDVLTYPGLERRAEVVGQPPRRYRVQIEVEGYRPFYRMILEGRRFDGPPFYRETATGIEFDAFPYNDTTPPQFAITESFELIERSLEELRKKLEEEEEVPDNDVDQLLEMLEQLLNQEVMGEERFLDLLRRTIGDEQMVRFKSFIAEAAFVAQPGTVLLAPAVNYPFPTHVLVLRGVVVDQQSRKPIVDAEVSWKNKEQVLTDEQGSFALPLRLTNVLEKTNPQRIDALDHHSGKTGTIEVQLPQALRRSQQITVSLRG